MIIFRVDDRLIHGQVVENWLSNFKINCVIVANDEVYSNDLSRNIMRFSTPEDIDINFIEVDKLKNFNFDKNKNYMVLFKGLQDVERVVKEDFRIERLNLGGIHYAKGRNFSMGKALFLSDEEKAILKNLIDKGVNIYMQAIPQEKEVPIQL